MSCCLLSQGVSAMLCQAERNMWTVGYPPPPHSHLVPFDTTTTVTRSKFLAPYIFGSLDVAGF